MEHIKPGVVLGALFFFGTLISTEMIHGEAISHQRRRERAVRY